MKPHHNLFGAIVLGIIVGLITTYPVALGPVQSFVIWGVCGVVLGTFTHGNKQAMWNGVYYGFFLSLSFLFSRYGGGWLKFLPYLVFVLGMSILGILGGVFTTLIGSKLRHYFQR